MAAALGKSEADVAQYTAAFFKLGPTHIDPVDWERWLSRIDKGEKRVRFCTCYHNNFVLFLVLVVVLACLRCSKKVDLLLQLMLLVVSQLRLIV
jgi:hypothetical protein